MASEYLKNYGVVNFTGAALTLTEDGHAGVTVVSNLAATQAITLPAATGSGNVYRIWVQITKTGDLTITAAGSDVINGAVGMSTDAAGVTILASAATLITLNGGTTGGVKGSYLELQDVASGNWSVRGMLVSTGAEATPFSAP